MTLPETTPPAGDEPAGSGRTRSAAWICDYQDAVYRYARRRLGEADADDVTQQAFAALFAAEAQGRPPSEPGAYLLGVARRRVADRFRRRVRGREPVRLPVGWDRFANDALPDEALEAAEMRELVHVALGLLTTADRALLRQRYRGGVSTEEIAVRLGVTPKAVEMRLRRARASFAERFHEVGRAWTEGDDDAGEGGR